MKTYAVTPRSRYVTIPHVAVRLGAHWLADRIATGRPAVDGKIIAFHFEPRAPVEFVFQSETGEQFYELPFSAVCPPPHQLAFSPEWFDDVLVHESLLGVPGTLVIVFEHARMTAGRYLFSFEFLGGNDLRHVIELEDMAIGYWPPFQVRVADPGTPLASRRPLPTWWRKRHYSGDGPVGGTRVFPDAQAVENLERVCSALSAPGGTWQVHGLGFLKRYLDEDDLRVHLWDPDLAQIGTESSIHTHRWGLTSAVVYGEIFHEEYHVSPRAGGPWRIWQHGNSDDDVESEQLDGEFDIDLVETHRIRAGEVYTFPRGLFHRTVVRGLAATVVRRSDPHGRSEALVVEGRRPLRGDRVEPSAVASDVPLRFMKLLRASK